MLVKHVPAPLTALLRLKQNEQGALLGLGQLERSVDNININFRLKCSRRPPCTEVPLSFARNKPMQIDCVLFCERQQLGYVW